MQMRVTNQISLALVDFEGIVSQFGAVTKLDDGVAIRWGRIYHGRLCIN